MNEELKKILQKELDEALGVKSPSTNKGMSVNEKPQEVSKR